jgi:cysteine dioxygenase
MNTIPTIRTLDQLRKIMHTGPGYDGYGTMLKSVEFNAGELEAICQWNTDSYQKISLESADCFELVLMCWEPGQASPIHNHKGQQSWVLVLQGELTEHYFKRPGDNGLSEEPTKCRTPKGELIYMNDELGVHKLVSHPTERTVSLHLFTGDSKSKTRDEFEAVTGEGK